MKLKLRQPQAAKKSKQYIPQLTTDLALEGCARLGYKTQSQTYDRHAIYYHPNAINQPAPVPAPDRADQWQRPIPKSETSLSARLKSQRLATIAFMNINNVEEIF